MFKVATKFLRKKLNMAKRSYGSLFQPFCCSGTLGKCWRCAWNPGPALASARPNAKPRCGAPVSSDAMTSYSLCSVNCGTTFLWTCSFSRRIIWISGRRP